MENTTKTFLWAQCGLAAVFCTAGALTLTSARASEETVAISTQQLVRSINAASAAKSGNIAEVEIERENGQTKVDIDVLATDGQKYEVSVEAATGKVLSVAVDTGNDDTESDKTEDGEVNDKD